MQSLHLLHHRELVGKWKRFNQLLTKNSSCLFAQFCGFCTIIKSPASLRARGAKQSTGILAGHNGKSSQRYGRCHWCKEQLSPSCSSPHPTLPFFANFKALEHGTSYRLKHLESPMNGFGQQIKKIMFL